MFGHVAKLHDTRGRVASLGTAITAPSCELNRKVERAPRYQFRCDGHA